MRALQLQRRLRGRNGHFLVAVVNDLDRARRLLAQLADMRFRQGGVAAIDVTDDVGVGLQHHVLVDQAGARNRRAASVDGALDAILARPAHHLGRLVTGLDRTQTHLAQQTHARLSELLEVLLDHALFNDRGARQNLDTTGAEVVKSALRGDRQRL